MAEIMWSGEGQATIPQVLRDAAQRWPDRDAVEIAGETLTFAELARNSTRLAHGLTSLGVSKGDTVCTMLDTSFDALCLLHAILMIGAISVPINGTYKGEFLRHQIADAGAAVLIAETDYAERIQGLADVLPDARILLHRGPAPQCGSRLDIRPFDTV